MGLFLHAAGSIPPTESAAERSLLHCEGANNQSYVCQSGHCCGESQCCSYYYELWWFWMVWAIIFILSCCCVCHHRRAKHRLQQQQRQHEINLIAYREAHNYPAVPLYFRFLPNYLLPHYEEVVDRPPTPPPPYSALQTAPASVAPSPLAPEQREGQAVPPTPTLTPTAPVAVSNGLCCRPSVEEPPSPSLSIRSKPDNKAGQSVEGLSSADGSCKDPLLKDLSEGCADDKDRLPNGRRRRFTGDSGIEMCLCGTRGSSSFSGAAASDEEDKEDFCDTCGHRDSFAVAVAVLAGLERQVPRGPSGPSQPAVVPGGVALQPAVCLLLQTINEQEAP
uniref:WW domain binding protein 1-like b n=2 Tax=Tetraodon nigroviridis TaxID=99883 RepID=H3D3G7_TETNG